VILVFPIVPPLCFDPTAGLSKRRTGDATIAANHLGIIERRETNGKSFSETAGSLLLRGRLSTLEPGHAIAS
jgi:hypothetical protein